ncbi:MAG: hypothetical protein ABIE14_05195 [Patescibacteria group bacterium]
MKIKKSPLVIFLAIIAIFFVAGIFYFSKTTTGANYLIEVGNEEIAVDKDQWKFVDNSIESIYSKNYSAINKKDGEMFEQMVTVFLNEMTDDRKSGEKITNSEYIEAFVVHPNSVTVQIRVDKGDYWALSRQTFKIKTDYPDQTDIPFSDLKYISIDAPDTLNQTMQNQIDNTRYILNNDF